MAAVIILEKYIASTRDMDAVEAAITKELRGENHRCAFLRSQRYRMLRLAALYKSDRVPYAIYHEGVCVSLDWTPMGKRVTLRSVDRRAYTAEEESFATSCPSSGSHRQQFDEAPQTPPWESRKAQRLAAL
jgi:hypothetical protein